ncbi:MAG: cation-translocating P-type ATPase [Gammaproteobacteria bacterium]|nr:cation-translocating P-type ATPase [Gammaproteobacteria bacterium]
MTTVAERTALAGLGRDEAARRLAAFGPNEIRRERGTSPRVLLLRQFASPVVLLLIVAGGVAAVLGERVNAIAIGAIVVLNACVGFYQEYRAENAVRALRSLTAPRARVRRDGQVLIVPAGEVVPGDVLLLEAGDIVAADGRLREAHALAVNEATLTGESLPVDKSLAPVPADAPLVARTDQVFLGTAVATGTGVAEVSATGMATELGRIAHLLATTPETTTPLQRRLAQVGRTLLYLCLVIVAVVGGLGIVRGVTPYDVFLSAVSLAVAAVPEGLPAIVTVALALGVQRMAARHALVRQLPAVETLGCATVICTDKTGTLTTGVMAVRETWGAAPPRLLDAAAACCDAELAADGSGIGDPTELALLVAAAAPGSHRADIERERPRLAVQPFTTARKRMSVLRGDGRLYVKGAPEMLLPLCRTAPAGAAAANQALAARGLRVLAIALGHGHDERELELLGLVGIADPPRPEVIEAVARARAAGITTVMITGDQPATAQAIAQELGIVAAGEKFEGRVYARATPEQKLTIVRELKQRGEVVAMTGDGVNDAPALREAHIGIAMGRGGTEVTREVADMVLTDDNYATIVAAVEEGRGIFDNIRKTLVYLLSGNAAELLVMLLAALAGLPLPLLPLQLLWINLATDGLPALALVTDPVSTNALRRPPRDPHEAILGRAQWQTIIATGALQAAIALAVFVWALRTHTVVEARNFAFTTLVFGELLRAFAARNPHRPCWEVGLFGNRHLVAVVALSLLLQIAIHYFPVTQTIFQLGPLTLADGAALLGIGCLPLVIIELVKYVRHRQANLPRRGTST